MKTNIDLIAGGSSIKKTTKKETNLAYIKRITHCELTNKNISELDGFQHCNAISVLYLYDNALSNLTNLQSCRMLTRLHLANNNLSNLEGNFKGLFNLTFLNLRGNQISHVDGLEDLALLETLHLDKQNLSEDQELSFDPTSLISLSGSLTTLTLSLNRIKRSHCVDYLSHFLNLLHLDISYNLIESTKTLEELVHQLPRLSKIITTGNPIQDRYIRQKLIQSSSSLENINEKDISKVERVFTERLKKIKKPSVVKKPVVVEKMIIPKPIPHLPAFASQYRDLYLHKLQMMQKESSVAAENQ